MQHPVKFGRRARRLTAQLLPARALSLVLVSPVGAWPLSASYGLNPSTEACSLITQQGPLLRFGNAQLRILPSAHDTLHPGSLDGMRHRCRTCGWRGPHLPAAPFRL
jgi:hypothetical protein